MTRIIAPASLMLLLTVLCISQTTTNTKTICKGDAIPEGYTIIGEAEASECANKAWVIKRRATPKLRMDQTVEAPVTQTADNSATTAEVPSDESALAAVDFAKSAFELLVQGDLSVEEMLDWDNLKVNGKEFGAALKQMAAAAGKDMSSVRKETITGFASLYKSTGEGPLTNWRVKSRDPQGVTVAANTPKGEAILFTVSTKGGRQIITGLGEMK